MRDSMSWLQSVGAMLILASCAGCTSLSVSVDQPTDLKDLLEASAPFVATDYHLKLGDQLTVRFYFNPQLDEDLQVRPDGNISLSLIGELRAIDLTPAQLSTQITNKYAEYFTKSTAVVIVRQFSDQRVFTGGEVKTPGQLNLLTGARTVLQSISASGGVTDQGTLTEVILVRRLPNQAAPMVTSLDLSKALSGRDPTQDVALLPNDLVYVPKSGIADFNLAVKEYLLNNLNLNTGVSVYAKTLQ